MESMFNPSAYVLLNKMNSLLFAGTGTFHAHQAVFCRDLMFVLLYHRFGWADTHACPAIVAKV